MDRSLPQEFYPDFKTLLPESCNFVIVAELIIQASMMSVLFFTHEVIGRDNQCSGE